MKMDWDTVEQATLGLRRHAPVMVPKQVVPHPREAGFYASVGLNRSASAHYRRRVEGGLRGIHVLAYDDHYLVHWDRIDPSFSVVLHFLDDVTWACARFLVRQYRYLAGRPQAVLAVSIV